MTTPDGPLPPDDEPNESDLTDAELDAALAAGNAELLDHVRAHADPAATLAALLDDVLDELPDQAPSPPDRIRPGELDRARALARDLFSDLVNACDHARDLARDLMELPVNASGADLTDVPLSGRSVWDGALD
ncbi:hypothetical protein BZB76_1072 [Actinomadura pelletieri DSM 43383]|uniref:Uncharacterized protein n=1 Tax=Actinomadura pelletieri DSM 43383 TaxID=1120940 RepID=A0A495QZU6_9ACTN|nr:hypothetical protein [Actinomadura pelletieri]RKS79597.1 hypothetical protein BZB76_1072 [Actinomadura pelletieri DSM 43383]